MIKKFIISIFIFSLISLLFSCSNNNDKKELELTEEEKELVNISLEKIANKKVFDLAEKLEPIEIKQEVKLFNPKPFEEFVPQNSIISEVSIYKANKRKVITIDYNMTGQRRYIVSYYDDGKVSKATETEYYLENFNNEEYIKKIAE
ncbi:hypothetical protein [Ornithinibacillus halophilus]|uniref:Lipoprotein n=1 Tax=Ornithinibacillus halophilus TaxID=930117 RepID=A0A1M5HFD7_9BACI|nr:hypothetical protein [Ornithinibacillus halophilus]SHG14699.1 hypothetical protein SAMN05216225_101738 [Ornithinibacillus halophilus]